MIRNALDAFRHSLLARLIAALSAALVLGAIALFAGLDYFVSGHFGRLREDQLLRSSDEVRRFVAAEGERLTGLATLLAKDADLNHSTFYHLFLAGEQTHPRAAVERIARSFALESVSLWGAAPIAAVPGPIFGQAPVLDAAPASRLLTEGDRAWLVADAPLLREGRPIAVLRIARPLTNVLAAGLPALYPAALKVIDGPPATGTTPIALPPVTLELSLPDTAGEALAGAKRVLMVILVGGGLLLGAFLVAYLRWQLKPLSALAEAAGAVGRGDFARRVAVTGDSEVARVARAFNAMASDLAQLRELERRLAHQEQLSAIGRVAARVAHDINNPLTVIANTARLALRAPPADPGAADDLRRIVHHCERCMRAVELLLDYGRPVRVVPAATDLVELVRPLAGRWRAEVVAGAPVIVAADRLQIEQLLDNLLTNARDAAGPQGRIVITIEADGGEARLTLYDDGPGFPADARAHLFEPFYTTKPGGTGLGLASALAIARAHGGEIEVGCAGETAGAAVTLRLPLQARPNVAAPR